MMRELVEIAARLAEAAGVLVVLGGLAVATVRYIVGREVGGMPRDRR